jgi:PAS domain S-box-containing protein
MGLLLIRMSANWQNRKALRESEEKHRVLLDESTDPIFSIEPDGKCLYVNKAFASCLEKTTAEIFGKKIWDFLNKDEAASRYIDLEQVLETGQVKTIEVCLPRNGNYSYYIATITPVKDHAGRILSLICSSKDITFIKLAEEKISNLNIDLEQKVIKRTEELTERTIQLAENEAILLKIVEDLNLKSEELKKITNDLQLVNKELESFAYTVSHDLHAPLRALDGFARILLEDYAASLDEEGTRLLRVITYNANKMRNLIDDLLIFSRLNQQEIRFSKIDMYAMVNSVYVELITDAEKDKIKFHLAKIPHAYGDSSMVRQVWVNLISNSIKYSSQKQNQIIEIGCKTEGTENIYHVKDNGAGFNMEHSGKLFGVFQRLHSVKDFDGTGVGLAIVHRIVLRHNGRIWAEGKVNEGATFYFSLPNQKINETSMNK